jgi:small subunit ribosomal protein S10e
LFSLKGVLVAEKEFHTSKEELEVPNLKVIKVMQHLTSKGYVKSWFSWQCHHYVLMPEGVEYLCEWCAIFLSLSFDI